MFTQIRALNKFHFYRLPSLNKRFISLSKDHAQLHIQWPKSTSQYHYTWLRDNCQCPNCLHPSTRQKLISSADIPLDIVPQDVQIKDQQLVIHWSPKHNINISSEKASSHESVFDLKWLKENCYSNDNVRKRRLLDHSYTAWNASQLKQVNLWMDYNDFVDPSNDHKHMHQFLSIMQKYGLGFLKNVPTNPENSLAQLAQHFGPIRETFYGKLFDVRSVPDAKNIAYTSLFLGLHMDLMYFESPPGLQFLHCLESSVKGGDSIFLDSFYAVEKLREQNPEAFETLCRVPVTFHYINDGHHMRFRRPSINVKDPNQPLLVYYAPPFQGPLEPSDPKDVPAFYEAFKEWGKIISDPALVYSHRLDPGDCAVFANRRVLHGRQAFDSLTGKRHLKGTYVDWDSFMDKLRVLKRAHG